MGALSRMNLQLFLHDQESFMRTEKRKSERLLHKLKAMHESFHLHGHTLITEQGKRMPTPEEQTETRDHLLQKSLRLNESCVSPNRIPLVSYPIGMGALSSDLASAICAFKKICYLCMTSTCKYETQLLIIC